LIVPAPEISLGRVPQVRPKAAERADQAQRRRRRLDRSLRVPSPS
jgi:hypothetical protein